MSMSPFAYADAANVADALGALDVTCRPLAGGTDLLALMKDGLEAPERLVNIKAIAALNDLAENAGGLRIGAAVTLSRLAAMSALGRPGLACLSQALLQTASPQLRHMATTGGNLVQRPRCWYYRNLKTPCWRKGGTRCYAFRGENQGHGLFAGGPCYAVHPSDPAVALTALEAQVRIAGPEGERVVLLEALYRKPDRDNRGDTVLALNELIVGVDMPAPPEGARGAYVKIAERASWDVALVSAAAQIVLAGGRVAQARIVLGGVAYRPWRAAAAEQALVGKPLSEETIVAAALAATEGARPLAHNAYKVELAQGAVRQALRSLM